MNNILIKLFMWMIKTLSNIFIVPIMLLVTTVFPDVSNYVLICQEFLSNYVFKGALFVKQVFINCTGISQTIFSFLFTYLSVKISLYLAMQVYKLIMKIWQKVKP